MRSWPQLSLLKTVRSVVNKEFYHFKNAEQLISVFDNPIEILNEAARSFFKAEYLTKATSIWKLAKSATDNILNANQRFSALVKIAKAQLEVGLFDEARLTADAIPDRDYRGNVLIAIVQAQADAGLFYEAKVTADSCPDSDLLRIIALAQAKAGLFAEARGTADKTLSRQDCKDQVSVTIVEVQAKAGLFVEAEATLQDIPTWAYKRIAIMGLQADCNVITC